MTNLDITKAYVGSTEVSKVYIGDSQVYPSGPTPPPTPVYSAMPLTFEIISGGTISWRADNTGFTKEIFYSVNDGEWTSIVSTTAGTPISLNDGDIVKFKGDGAISTGNGYTNRFRDSSADLRFNVYGNIMSLVDSTGYTTATTVADHGFRQLFASQTSVVSALNLVVPAGSVGDNSFKRMFQGCTNLTTAPELPATTVGQSAYQEMFSGCTALITAPSTLPASTVGDECYAKMFYGCTALTTAPTSIGTSATTMSSSACTYMFYGCTSLTTTPELPATTLAESCYSYMFLGCTSLTTAPGLPATTLADGCYEQMFDGCSSLTTAPELPATTLATKCYFYMFNGCSNLNYIKCLATDISASNCTNGWLTRVAATGTFEGVLLDQWPTNGSGIPNGWTTIDNFDYSSIPLTFKVLTSGMISWRADNTGYTKELSYRVNGGSWTTITSTTAGVQMSFNSDDIVEFKSDGPCATGNSRTNRFRDYSSDLRFNIYGNIMSLIDSTGYTTATTVDDHALRQLFALQPIVSAKNLVLPATTVGANGYKQMFDRCSYLTKAPELPATTLGVSAYQNMFQGTSLTTAPSTLLADTIGDQCYEKMFSGCTSLITPPASIGTSAITMAASACSSMFYGCTNLESAPELPAATLNVACYKQMFQNCTSLSYIKCLATDISASNCTNGWVTSVASRGTFVKNANMSSWTTGSDGIPTNWTIQDAS